MLSPTAVHVENIYDFVSACFHNPNNNQTWQDGSPAWTNFNFTYVIKNYVFIFIYNPIIPLTNMLDRIVNQHELALVSTLVFHAVKFNCYRFHRSAYKAINVAHASYLWWRHCHL